MAQTGLFASAEVGHRLEKAEYEQKLEALRVHLLNTQYDCRTARFSSVVIIAGDDRPSCVAAVRALHEWMDARYLETHVLFGESDWVEEEIERPGMWRYWKRLPPQGRIGIFLGGWPTHFVQTALGESWDDNLSETIISHLERFERTLAENGTLVLKFWLHLPKQVLEKRIRKARKNPDAHWDVDADWRILEDYSAAIPLVERLIRRTRSASAPWNIVESSDRRYRDLTVALRIHEALARRLESESAEAATPAPTPTAREIPADGRLVLDGVDLSASLEKDVYEKELDQLQAELHKLSREARKLGVACVMAFEGWDAAGKGGAIRRITRAMPVANYRVVPIAAPNEEERARHYLWRFWRQIPRNGRSVIFDRSWYGRVLVERVEGFAPEEAWRRAYAEINDFEEQLDMHGIAVLKFWLHIDSAEQLRRFEARAATAYKKYKLTDDDYRNREQWPLYERAVHDMVIQTSTAYAPWTLVAANDKRHARVEVLRHVVGRLEARVDAARRAAKQRKKARKGRKGK